MRGDEAAPAGIALSWTPAMAPERGLVLQANGTHALVDEEGTPIVGLNALAAAILELCDGRTSVEEMVEAMLLVWDMPPEQVRSDVLGFLAELKATGALDLEA